MNAPKLKVLAYITRSKASDLELLVFEHQGMPEAGIQVPAGTVDPDESSAQALRREVLEESGLELKSEPRLIGEYPYVRPDTGEHQIRCVFHRSVHAGEIPDR